MNYELPKRIEVSLGEVIERDLDGFREYCSELATGTTLLKDLQWEVVAANNGNVVIEVNGNDSEVAKYYEGTA
jgi:hypothetical protein